MLEDAEEEILETIYLSSMQSLIMQVNHLEKHVILQHMMLKNALTPSGHKNVLMTSGMQAAEMTSWHLFTKQIEIIWWLLTQQ